MLTNNVVSFEQPGPGQSTIVISLQKLERSYTVVIKLTSGLSERETNDVLNAHVGITSTVKYIHIIFIPI